MSAPACRHPLGHEALDVSPVTRVVPLGHQEGAMACPAPAVVRHARPARGCVATDAAGAAGKSPVGRALRLAKPGTRGGLTRRHSGRAVAVMLLGAMSLACVRLPTPPALVDEGATRKGLRAGPGGAPLDFTAKRWPDGSTWRLSQERGSVVLLDVWATWCEPCRESLPFYGDVATQFAGKGLKVYALSVDADTSPIGPFMQELKLSLPVLHDPGAAMAEETLKVRQMPTSFVIDRRGIVRHVHEGLSEDYFQQTLTEVEALLAEPAAP